MQVDHLVEHIELSLPLFRLQVRHQVQSQKQVPPSAHLLIQLAQDKGCNAQTPKEAVEFLCSMNYVFGAAQNPEFTLESLDLSGADLSGGVFIGTRFDNSNLQGAKLENAILWKTSLKKCNLSKATVTSPTKKTGWQLYRVAHSRCGRYIGFGCICYAGYPGEVNDQVGGAGNT